MQLFVGLNAPTGSFRNSDPARWFSPLRWMDAWTRTLSLCLDQVIRSLTRNLTAQVAQAVGTVNPVATATLSFGFIDVLLRRGKKVD